MRTLKLMTVVGARPQFIKVAAVKRAIDHHNATAQGHVIHNQLIHTGQHYDDNMSSIFFQQLGLTAPDFHLTIGGGSHGLMTGRMLESIEAVLIAEKPHWVVVYGDTNSTLAGALAAAKLNISVAHVEAGLRSHNRTMPEEINRIVADHCSDLLLTTHHSATAQLRNEGIAENKICEVGDVMCDVAQTYKDQNAGVDILKRYGLDKGQYGLVTIHRASNTDDAERLREIMRGLNAIAAELPLLFPTHPRTRQALAKVAVKPAPGLHIVEPVGYFEMLALESHARIIITDSGGVQKEAYFCQVPCLILRTETEWVGLVEHGFSKLVPGDAQAIKKAYQTMINQKMTWIPGLYGDGRAAHHIVKALLDR